MDIVKRKRIKFESDPSRVIVKYYNAGDENTIKRIIERVLSLSSDKVNELLDIVIEDFSHRHKNIENIIFNNFQKIEKYIDKSNNISEKRKLLLGSYFSHEYSVEATALFNPSVVLHPNQENLKSGTVRFIFSFRAVGEGHISSIVFRSGIFDEKNNIIMDPITPFLETPKIELNPKYDKHTFLLKLKEINYSNETCERIFSNLDNTFYFQDLLDNLEKEKKEYKNIQEQEKTITNILWIAESNYEETFNPDSYISERVIFPFLNSERNGIEDARFVRFVDNKEITYYATYTAYNGYSIVPMLLETKDFLNFKIRTLNGKESKDKGMALFPRKINNKYVIISRQDSENLYIMESNNLHFWNEKKLLKKPKYSWEFIKIGNCGSPIETEKGWVLLTHGVGALRKYCIGAMLLDLENPSKIIAELKEPLIMTDDYTREGYVPNVVYTCGAIINNNQLVIPYAFSDTLSGVSTINIKELFNKFGV